MSLPGDVSTLLFSAMSLGNLVGTKESLVINTVKVKDAIASPGTCQDLLGCIKPYLVLTSRDHSPYQTHLDVFVERSYRLENTLRIHCVESNMTSTKTSAKPILIGLIAGLALGLWFGMNIGKEKPIWSNPFSEMKVGQKIRQQSGEILEKGGQMLEKKGEKLKK
jgi:hypothetical protein